MINNNLHHQNRCPWCLNDPLNIQYHDTQWGVPCHNDNTLFEALVLESCQSGLSWLTVLKKRHNYRKHFFNFDPSSVAKLSESSVNTLLQNKEVIRHKGKIESIINNAKAVLNIQERYGSFQDFLWEFVNHQPQHNQFERMEQIPTTTPLSNTIYHSLKQHGFTFIGSKTCYAFLQASGIINNHLVSCFRYKALQKAAKQLEPNPQ